MKVIDKRRIKRAAYGIAASAIALFGGLAALELKDRIGYSIVEGVSYPVNKYGDNGKSTFYSPNALTTIKLIDEDGNGIIDKKQITVAIPRAGCKYNQAPTLEDQVLFDKILSNVGKTNTISQTNSSQISEGDVALLISFMNAFSSLP